MSTYVGVDWASKGWVAVVHEDGDWKAEMYPSIHSVWFSYRHAQNILIDIPIGLPESQRRVCDQQAKEYIGTDRASSVFWTPCRDVLNAMTYEEAKQINHKRRGNKISSQTWHILPRIQEVDCLLRDSKVARKTILESHPEVCFTALSSGSNISISSKLDGDGFDQRLAILDNYTSATAIYENFVDRYITSLPQWSRRIGKSNRDDLVDALALAVTAKLATENLSTLPDDPPTDKTGLPMQIVYTES